MDISDSPQVDATTVTLQGVLAVTFLVHGRSDGLPAQRIRLVQYGGQRVGVGRRHAPAAAAPEGLSTATNTARRVVYRHSRRYPSQFEVGRWCGELHAGRDLSGQLNHAVRVSTRQLNGEDSAGSNVGFRCCCGKEEDAVDVVSKPFTPSLQLLD